MFAVNAFKHAAEGAWDAGKAGCKWVATQAERAAQKVAEIWEKVKPYFELNRVDASGEPATFVSRFWIKTVKPAFKYAGWQDPAVIAGGIALGAIATTLIVVTLGAAAIPVSMIAGTGAVSLGGYKAHSQVTRRKNLRVCERLEAIKNECYSITTNPNTHYERLNNPKLKKRKEIQDKIVYEFHKIEKSFPYIPKDYKQNYDDIKKKVEFFREKIKDQKYYPTKTKICQGIEQLEQLVQNLPEDNPQRVLVQEIKTDFKNLGKTKDFDNLRNKLQRLSQQDSTKADRVTQLTNLLGSFQRAVDNFAFKSFKKRLLDDITAFQRLLVSDWTGGLLRQKSQPAGLDNEPNAQNDNANQQPPSVVVENTNQNNAVQIDLEEQQQKSPLKPDDFEIIIQDNNKG